MAISIQPSAQDRVRFRADEYGRMLDAGLLQHGRYELIEGRIIRMAAQRDPHMWSTSKASGVLHELFPRGQFSVIVQGTLWLDPKNVPDPDLQVFDVPIGTPLAGLTPFLLIEVSHTTYRKDSGVKLRRYAANGIEDYWIINVDAGRLEVYRKPMNPTGKRGDWRYAEMHALTLEEIARPLRYPQIRIAVGDLL